MFSADRFGRLVALLLTFLFSIEAASAGEVVWTPWYTTNLSSNHELSNSTVTTISSTTNDQVWLATTEGVYRYDRGLVEPIAIDWFLHSKYPLQRVIDFHSFPRKGVYLFSQRDGIFKLNSAGSAFRPIQTDSPWSAGKDVTALLVDADHDVAVSIIDGSVFAFEPRLGAVYQLAIESRSAAVAIVKPDSESLSIITSDKRLTKFVWQRDRYVKSYSNTCSLPDILVEKSVKTSGDIFYLAGVSGSLIKAHIDESGCEVIPFSDAMAHHLTRSSVHDIQVLENGDGVVLATDLGVFIEQNSETYLISSDNSRLNSNETLAVEEIAPDKILIGSFLGLTQASRTGSIIVTSVGSESNPSVTSIDNSHSLGTFVATYENLYRVNRRGNGISFSRFLLPEEVSGISVVKVGSSSVWLGLQDGRLLNVDHDTNSVLCEQSPPGDSAPITDIEILTTHDHQIIASALNGRLIKVEDCELVSSDLISNDSDVLMLLSLDRLDRTRTLLVGLGGSFLVKGLFEKSERDQNFFNLTRLRGLNDAWDMVTTDRDSFIAFPSGLVQRTSSHDLEAEIVSVDREWRLAHPAYAIEADELGRAWVASQDGLRMIDSDQISLEIQTYGDVPISLDYGAAHTSSDGTMYFGGTGGLVVIVDTARYPAIATPQYFLNSIVVSGEAVNVPAANRIDEIKVSSANRSLSFKFGRSGFQVLESRPLSFILEGFDPDWQSAGNFNSINYSKLPPGEYVFRAKGANASGTWSENEIAIPVRVLGPPWLRWWALMTYLLLALGLLVLAKRMHERTVAERLRLEIAESAAAAYQRLEDDFQELQESSEEVSRSRSAAADELLALARLCSDAGMLPASAEEDIAGCVASRLENLRVVHRLAGRSAIGDSSNLNEVLEALHRQLLSEHPETAAAILVNDVTQEPVPLEDATHIGLVLYETLAFTLRERNYEPAEDPILEVRLPGPHLQEDGRFRYDIFVRDSALPDRDQAHYENALLLTQHLAESTGGEVAQSYDRGNVLNITLYFDSRE